MNPYVELATLLVQSIFTLINQGKLTAEQVEEVYRKEVEKFKANPPSTLPNV